MCYIQLTFLSTGMFRYLDIARGIRAVNHNAEYTGYVYLTRVQD